MNLGQGERGRAPGQESGEATAARGQCSGFPGGSLGAQTPSVTSIVPTPSLDPAGHLHPAISGPLHPWGSGPWGPGARNWPKLQETHRTLRPILPTVKIPLFFYP